MRRRGIRRVGFGAVGAGARETEEEHLEPGLERSRSRAPREEGCSEEYEHEEEEGLKRT